MGDRTSTNNAGNSSSSDTQRDGWQRPARSRSMTNTNSNENLAYMETYYCPSQPTRMPVINYPTILDPLIVPLLTAVPTVEDVWCHLGDEALEAGKTSPILKNNTVMKSALDVWIGPSLGAQFNSITYSSAAKITPQLQNAYQKSKKAVKEPLDGWIDLHTTMNEISCILANIEPLEPFEYFMRKTSAEERCYGVRKDDARWQHPSVGRKAASVWEGVRMNSRGVMLRDWVCVVNHR